MQNLEPVLRACPELQKLNLASCALLGQSALDALLPAGAGLSQPDGRQQVGRLVLIVDGWPAKDAPLPWSCLILAANSMGCHCLPAAF